MKNWTRPSLSWLSKFKLPSPIPCKLKLKENKVIPFAHLSTNLMQLPCAWLLDESRATADTLRRARAVASFRLMHWVEQEMGLIFMAVRWSRRSVIRGPFLVQSPSPSWSLCICYGSSLSYGGVVGVKAVVGSVRWIFWPHELSGFSSSFKSGWVVDAKALMSRNRETLAFITMMRLRNSGTCSQSL